MRTHPQLRRGSCPRRAPTPDQRCPDAAGTLQACSEPPVPPPRCRCNWRCVRIRNCAAVPAPAARRLRISAARTPPALCKRALNRPCRRRVVAAIGDAYASAIAPRFLPPAARRLRINAARTRSEQIESITRAISKGRSETASRARSFAVIRWVERASAKGGGFGFSAFGFRISNIGFCAGYRTCLTTTHSWFKEL